MADSKFDFKKEYRDLYLPKGKPMLIEVPAMNFIMVDGRGAPEGADYQEAVGILYGLSFTIKMSKLSGTKLKGYREYEMLPLEGIWWGDEGVFIVEDRSTWRWTSMIRQMDFVTPDVFAWALEECSRKKPELNLSRARLETFREGTCVQIMHTGPYAEEPVSFKLMENYMEEQRLIREPGWETKHHEIYIKNPMKTKPENLKTVLRQKVKKL
ncbi:GyrI-like domain-containing protein [Breznakiella homolactica]|uniref:GyrI-like domain-containing protein n=1 Tax=Breznakiella homolactica TaxID=2798577 RepID=A0A7T7XNN9_9SPIR|nr:GyrI-like domain-containing protein [Breznakiella homolactica]QQO09597.1 GyrI-like domain-containing protein [Breznakiella homolactica]